MIEVSVIRKGGTRRGAVISATIIPEAERLAVYAKAPGGFGIPTTWENRNDWKTYEAAAEVAAALGPEYQATDAGEWVSPRYDVIDIPKVGTAVSYTFNGDAYPCGKIVSISPGPGFRKIVAEDESGRRCIFWRRCRNGLPIGGAWIMNGTWSLIEGTINKRNPEF